MPVSSAVLQAGLVPEWALRWLSMCCPAAPGSSGGKVRSAPPGTSRRRASAATRGRSNQCRHCPRLPHPSWPPPPLCPQDPPGPGWSGLGGPGLGWAGVSVAGSGSGLGMALLGEHAQPPEELVNDGAELAPYDQPVEHGGGRVGWRVVRLDPHRGLVACRGGETGGEPIAGEHLAEPEGVANHQERRARV